MYNYINNTGVIVPDTDTLQNDIVVEYREALGQDLVVTPDTPQGVIIATETTARQSVVANNAKLANQINPNEAGGIFLDAVCAFLGQEREGATRTVVPAVTIGGQPQTLVPAGSQARTPAGDIFRSIGAALIGADGTGTVDFESIEVGPVVCAPGALNSVVDMVLGWDRVVNPYEGVIGKAQQSDSDLRSLRNRTLARQGMSVSEAIVSDLNVIARSVSYRENIEPTAQVIDGISMVAHSIYVCVDGAEDEEIAAVLLANKTVGANWNGEVSRTMTDPSSGQTYIVKFARPSFVNIFVRVTVRVGRDKSDPMLTIPQAIVDYANGRIPNEDGLVLGQDASPFEFASAINYYRPMMTVTKLELSTDGITFVPGTIPLGINQRGQTQQSFVQITVVQ